MKRARASLLAGLLTLGLGQVGARTVRIIQADSLELNKVDDQEIVVISGARVELHIDNDVVVAQRVEFNRTKRTLTLVGLGRYDAVDDKGAVQHLSGSDLVVNLGTQALTGEDVIISDSELEIRGEAVERVPGRLNATGSYFTPCAKCGRTPNDYAFKAKRLVVYPGDRLIGYEATLLLAGTPVLYLPFVALPLNDPARQPKFSYSSDAVDGRTLKADLPFAIGENTLGTTLLRYYQNRSPSFGVGTDLTIYAPKPYIDRVNLYALAEPNPIATDGTVTPGYEIDYNFNAKGHFLLDNTAQGLTYSVSAARRDIGLLGTNNGYFGDPDKKVTRINGQADVTYINVPYINKVRVSATINDRLGPEPTTALSTPLKRPEISVDPDPYLQTFRSGSTLSADFKVTLGRYSAQSNPLSRSASSQGPNYSAWRLQEEHRIAYNAALWENATFTAFNNFTGRYYSTGQRVVDLEIGASVTQNFGVRLFIPPLSYTTYGTALYLPASAGNVTVGVKYLRREGVSPFAFDRLDSQRISAPVGVAVNLTPGAGVALKFSQDYDLMLPYDQQNPFNFNANVAREPLQLSLDVKHDFFKKQLQSVALSGSFGAQAARGLNFSFAGNYSLPLGADTLTTTVKAIGGVRTNVVGVSLVQDLQKKELRSVSITGSAVRTRDNVLNPVTLSATETVNLQGGNVSGNYSLTWRNYTFASSHNLTLPKGNLTAAGYTNDSLFFSVGNVAGSTSGYSSYTSYGSTAGGYGGYNYGGSSYAPVYNANFGAPSRTTSLTWRLEYGGPYDLATQQWTQPALSASITATRPAQRISAQASVAFPGSVQQNGPYLQSASLGGDWQFNRRVALSGLASYTRTQPYGPQQPITETLTLQPLAFNFSFGRGERPDAYLTATFQQTLTWTNGVRSDLTPLQPILLLTIDRCCWALQAQVDPLNKRFRIGLVVPGAGSVSAFESSGGVNRFPLFNTTPSVP